MIILDRYQGDGIMLKLASREQYQDGQIIFEEGGTEDKVYVIISGGVEISKMVRGMNVTLEELGSGQVFGELSFLGSNKRTATARAKGETTIGLIDRDTMSEEYHTISSGFRTIIEAMMARFRKVLDRTTGFASITKSRIQKTLSVNYKDRDTFIKAFTGDISTGGLFIITENPLKRGEEFILKLQLPGLDKPMVIKSLVAWSRKREGKEDTKPVGMGVKFSKITNNDLSRLKQYLQNVGGDQ
jgi:uncharacterized protein (TIGR02266 family)